MNDPPTLALRDGDCGYPWALPPDDSGSVGASQGQKTVGSERGMVSGQLSPITFKRARANHVPITFFGMAGVDHLFSCGWTLFDSIALIMRMSPEECPRGHSSVISPLLSPVLVCSGASGRNRSPRV